MSSSGESKMVNVAGSATIPVNVLDEVLPFVVRWDSDYVMGNPDFPKKEFLRRLLDFANDSSLVSRRDFAIWLDNTDWNSRDFLRRFAKLPETIIVRCFDYESDYYQMFDALKSIEHEATEDIMLSVFGLSNAKQIYRSLDRFSYKMNPSFVIVVMAENMPAGELRTLLYNQIYGQNRGYEDLAERTFPIDILLDLQTLHNAKHGMQSQ